MSEEKQETIADIIAEKRKRIEEIRCNLSAVPIRREEQLAEIEYIEVEVSRLEAAAKREETQLGNAAAMREALEIAKKAICHHARKNHTCDSLAWESSTINANCGDILCAHRDLCEAKTAIQKALSLPPRNCDSLGGDEEKLFDCYIQERKASKYKDLFYDYGFWLLKTAKTKGDVE